MSAGDAAMRKFADAFASLPKSVQDRATTFIAGGYEVRPTSYAEWGALTNERDDLKEEVAVLRRQAEERGDVVRVDVPDKAECVWIANEAQLITGRSIWPDTVDAVLRVVRSRLVPATPPPDVVPVPREILEAARNLIASMGYQLAGMRTLAEIDDALRSGEAVATPPPDVVPVPREELEILRDGFGLLRTAWNISGFNERLNAQADALIERHNALRSGEAGKDEAEQWGIS